jgi:uncharacterized membrane-anchored protein YjiN (DUF445 family)
MLSIRLPAPTSQRVAKLAKERHVSVSELVRQAIEQFDGPTLWERIEPLVGKKGSGRGDLSKNKAHLAGFGK